MEQQGKKKSSVVGTIGKALLGVVVALLAIGYCTDQQETPASAASGQASAPVPAASPVAQAAVASSAAPTASATTPVKATPEAELKIGMPVKEWQTKMNQSLKKVDLPQLVAKETKCDEGDKCTQQFLSGKLFAAVVTFDKSSREIIDMMGVAAGNGEILSGLNIMLGYNAMVESLSGEVPKEERGPALMSIFKGATDDPPAKDNHVVIGSIRYEMVLIPGMGIMMSATRDH